MPPENQAVVPPGTGYGIFDRNQFQNRSPYKVNPRTQQRSTKPGGSVIAPNNLPSPVNNMGPSPMPGGGGTSGNGVNKPNLPVIPNNPNLKQPRPGKILNMTVNNPSSPSLYKLRSSVTHTKLPSGPSKSLYKLPSQVRPSLPGGSQIALNASKVDIIKKLIRRK